MSRRRFPWLLALTTAGCAGLDGLSGGPDKVAPTADAGGSDAPLQDGSGPVDAGNEGAPSDGGFSCATLTPAPRLCVDFSDGLLRSPGMATSTDFDDQTITSAAAPLLDTAVFASPKASARFDIGPGSISSFLYRTFPMIAPARIEFAVSMRIDRATTAQLNLMELRFGFPYSAIFLATDGVSASVVFGHSDNDGGTSYDATPLGKDLPRGQWTRVAWVVETGAAPNISVSIGGESRATKVPLVGFKAATGLTFVAGFTTATTGSDVKLWVDDVVADF